MIQFNVEEFRADFAKALATRPEVEKIVETVEKRGYDNLVFIGVGGTEIEWRSVLDTLRGKFSCRFIWKMRQNSASEKSFRI